MKKKLPPKRFGLWLICVLLIFSLQAVSQIKHNVNGHVIDERGQPLPGVSIKLQGSTYGTTTDQNGFYKISIPNDSTLLFSFIGYLKISIPVTSSWNGDVIMVIDQKTGTLGEVVVIGYGSRQKANVTGAISSIKGEVLEKSPVANLSNAIAGAVPGLIVNTSSGEPGADDASILIRGKGTLNNTDPLIVVDGVPDRSFNRLDPADIESFTVLKDASAAIYGARAANGVILITTKRGKAGKSVLSFTTNYSLTQPTRVPQMLSSWEYAQSTNEYNNLIGQQPTYSAMDIQQYKDGSDPLGHPNTDWWKTVMRTWTPQTNNVLTLSGGSDKVKYFISGQHLFQNSMYNSGTDYYKNDNARINLDVQATNNFKIGIDVLYRDEYKNAEAYSAGDIFNELWQAYPYLVPRYPNGLLGVSIGGGPGNLIQILNGDIGYNHSNYDALQTKTSFSWALPSITSGLHLDGYFAYDNDWDSAKGFGAIPPPAYSYNVTTKHYDEYFSTSSPNLGIQNTTKISKLIHLQLGYDHSFGKHTINAFVAYEQQQQTYTELDASRNGFLSNTVQELYAGSVDGETNNSNTTQFARQNYIGRISYNYDNRYLLDINARYDGSSNFPAGKRFGLFPSVSAAWRISQEKFWDPNAIVDNLKIRASYGLTGNDAISAFNYIQLYNLGTGSGNSYYYGPGATGQATLTPGVNPNTEITWERAKKFNIGIDMELWHDLTASVDVFQDTRSDILIPPTLSTPDYAGLSLPNENLGKVKNHGLEIDLAYRNKIGNSFNYHVNGNLTYAVNKIVFKSEPSNVPFYQKNTGYPIDSWLLYKAQGIYQTQAEVNASPHPDGAGPGDIKYVDVNGDGQINGLDQIRSTLSNTPQIMFGTTFGGSWKNWDFTIFLQGQARAMAILQPSGLNIAEQFFTGRWVKEGDNNYPRTFNGPTSRTFGSNTYASTFWLKNDAFIRLKNVEVGYTFSNQLLSKIKIQSARVYISANNIISIDSFGPSFDPESAIGNVNNGRYYPQQRIINIGANIKF